MYLTPGTLVPYLLQKGVLVQADLLEENWVVLQADPERPVLYVSASGRGWVVKQASPLDRHRVAMLDREAAIFQLAAEVSWAKAIRPFLPRLQLYDPGVHALVTARLPYDTGLDCLRRQDVRPDTFGRRLGLALAKVHVELPQRNASGGLLSERLPWILDLDSAAIEDTQLPAVHRLLKLIEREPGLVAAITGLKQDWQGTSLIHGDAKLDNVLVRMGQRPHVWFVDWAFSGIGDPAWDVGTLIHSCLVLWLHGIGFSRDRPFDEAIEHASIPLPTARAFISALLAAYEHEKRFTEGAAMAFARRAFLFAGAALVQTAVAAARVKEELTPRQLAVVQTAMHLLADPEDALREFRHAA